MAVAVIDLMTDVLRELNMVRGLEAPQQIRLDEALSMTNRVLQLWNAQFGYAYGDFFPRFTTVPNLLIHTIGPSVGATWAFGRPVSIQSIVLLLGSPPSALVLDGPKSLEWWQTRPAPDLTGQPTAFVYNPQVPDGSILFDPTPDAAYLCQLQLRVRLAQMAMADQVDLPDGYRDALIMTVAERMSGPWRKPWSAQQKKDAVAARSVIQSVNVRIPQIATKDAGMPGGDASARSNFNWMSGQLLP